MITIGMNYKVLPGKEKAFEDVFRAVQRAMGEDPGHTQSRLFRDAFDPQQYLIISDWKDQAAFDRFIASESFRKVTRWGMGEILAGRPTHETYLRP